MKILFSPCHYAYIKESGSEFSWSFNIADRIGKQNTESVVVTGFKDNNEYSYSVKEVQSRQAKIDLGIRNSILFNIQYFIESIRQLKRMKFDIVHHVLPFRIDFTFNFIFLKKKRIPFVVGPIQSPSTFSDGSESVTTVLLKKALILPLNFLSKQTLLYADKIIVIDEFTKNLLLQRNIDEIKIQIINPGIDSSIFFPKTDKELNSRIRLVCTGHLIKRKGVDLLIKALAEVVKVNDDVVLDVYGEGSEKENLRKMVENLGLLDHVFFKGLVPFKSMPECYQNADMFVSMSRWESWGQMYLEAMACGLPVIASKNTGSESIIKDGEFGYLVEQEDFKDLSLKILALINNKKLRERFGLKARKETIDKYDWEKCIIPKYKNIYEELVLKYRIV